MKELAKDPLNLIIGGVGGQGNVLMALLVGRALLNQGLVAGVGDTYGVSQRGGAVASHVRMSKDRSYGPLIPAGHADIILTLEPIEVRFDSCRIERHRTRIRQFRGENDIRRREAVGGERRGDLAEWYDDLPHADLRRICGAVSRSGTAERVEHEVARIVAGFDDGLSQEIPGLRVLHRVDRGRGLLDGEPERLGDLGADRLACKVFVQRLAPDEPRTQGQARHENGNDQSYLLIDVSKEVLISKDDDYFQSHCAESGCCDDCKALEPCHGVSEESSEAKRGSDKYC